MSGNGVNGAEGYEEMAWGLAPRLRRCGADSRLEQAQGCEEARPWSRRGAVDVFVCEVGWRGREEGRA